MRTLIATAALALAVIGLAAPSGALARSHKCPHHHGQLAGDSFGNAWHHGASLYACTTVYDHKPGARRLGPWTSATKIAWDGVDAVWSVRQNGIDRMWAANADNGKRWLSATNLVPDGAGHPFLTGRVQRILLSDQSAAWITQQGQVVMALHDPADDPEAVGALPAPLVAVKQLLLVGSYPSIAPATLAATAKLQELDGDGDECGGVNPYKLTFQPDSSGPRLGAQWDGYWESTNCS
jgi:hypothetical protein